MEVESDILSVVIGCKGYHERASEYGERAWMANGKKVGVVYWDIGNGWCDIMDVIPKNGGKQNKVVKFYMALNRTIAKSYDEDFCRID